MREIPSAKLKWYERKIVVEALGFGPPIFAAGYAAFAASRNPATAEAVPLLIFACLWLVVAGIAKVWHAWSEDRKKSAQNPLHACLCVIRAVVAKRAGIQDDEANALRITFHRVKSKDDAPDEIEQLTPYVGGDGGKAGRRFSVRVGVAGKAARTGKPELLMFSSALNPDDRLKELQDRWGYADSDGRIVLSKQRLSFLAVPIVGKTSKRSMGVVYLDSTREGLFDDANIRLVIDACHGVSQFVEEHLAR